MDHVEICRICCEPRSEMSAIVGSGDNDDDNFLQRMFDQVLRLEISPDDGLPQKVCATCKETLRSMQETIEMARANDAVLRRELLGGAVFDENNTQECITNGIQLDLLTDSIIEEDHHMDLSSSSSCEEIDAIVDENVIIEEVLEEWVLSDAEGVSDSELCSTDQEEPGTVRQQESTDSGNVSSDIEESVSGKMSDREVEEDVPKRRRGRPRKRLVSPPPPKRYRRRSRVKFSKGDDVDRPRKNDFRCYVCKSESLGSAEALYAHLSRHEDQLPYTCTVCVMEQVVISGSVLQLNIHKRMHENPIKCDYCDRRYNRASAVELHVQLHHLGKNVAQSMECGHCGKVCASLPALKTHEKLHTRALECEFCGKLFTGRNKLREHIRRKHSKEKEFACKLCGKEFATLLAIQSHLKIKHSTQEFKCSYCDRTYSSDQSRKFHEKKHNKNGSYQASNKWAKYYTVVGSEGRVKKKQCNLCGVIVGAIGPHMTSTHFPQKYTCDQCNAEFSNKTTYVIHVAEHEKGKAHRCPICEKEFSLRQHLMTHLKTKKHRDHPLSKLFFKKIPTTVEEMFGADMPEQLLDDWEAEGSL